MGMERSCTMTNAVNFIQIFLEILRIWELTHQCWCGEAEQVDSAERDPRVFVFLCDDGREIICPCLGVTKPVLGFRFEFVLSKRGN